MTFNSTEARKGGLYAVAAVSYTVVLALSLLNMVARANAAQPAPSVPQPGSPLDPANLPAWATWLAHLTVCEFLAVALMAVTLLCVYLGRQLLAAQQQQQSRYDDLYGIMIRDWSHRKAEDGDQEDGDDA